MRFGSGATPLPERQWNGLPRVILRTIVYADLFDAPLTIPELHSNLVGRSVPREDLERCLREDDLIRRRVEQRDGILHLRDREELRERRKEQEAATNRLIAENEALLARLARIPFLRLLAFSGGTSHKNSPSHHDIDLFIVAAPRRLWLTYACVITIARAHRRRHLICANYLVDESHLRLPMAGDLFTGHQMIHLRPLTGAPVYRSLLDANPWVRAMFPNADPRAVADLRPLSRGALRMKRAVERGFAPIWDLAERLARALLGPSLRRKAALAAGESFIASDGILKLHLKDNRRRAITRLRRRLEDEGLWEAGLDAYLDPPADRRVAPPQEPAAPAAPAEGRARRAPPSGG